ncbi:arginine--tRNA ligase [Candidatus Pacearchaeota archaeon CG1_02_30_18]|nr:MAG: arginine--tRNA ligase [Candidatus Pacearchaeota archaeon CG1_02_30_18]PIZ81850.1 MAG: arginine--tRNA ligase [Candidatus Pacearchaeota archaeon CG_4_10_14_0_2_um_filter_30_11]PJA71418.1 MAG: arginine--tRNA ligase [Candidatus Pacearchaeota archaeon CG_4_9_14_3_um_filter_30_11]
MKEMVFGILKEALKKIEVKFEEDKIKSSIEVPKDYSKGDFAFPCFVLASTMKMPPHEIAIQIREAIGNPPLDFESIETEGAYINFFSNRKILALRIISKIKRLGSNFGKSDFGKKEKVMVEFPSPNTNKPLHLGHLRNMSIGESISRISEFNGEKIIRTNLNNDRGIHICKSMLAYKKWGKGKKPSKKIKSDHLVGDFYVKYSKKEKVDPKIEKEAHDMLGKWESGDKETILLWKKMNKWALDGFKETYKNFGIKHDKEYFESNIYTKGREIILKGVEKGIFEKIEDGSVKLDLKKEGLGEKYLLRADGTSLYITQDIYLAYLKQKEFHLTKSYYVVGNEQNYHFDVLFNVLKKLEITLNGLKHVSYGMVNLPEGKMKSREGIVVDADDLLQKMKKLAEKEIIKRGKISKKELEKRSHLISLAAIKYFLLKVDSKKDMLFNPKESISFDGNTGPYLLYSYARANSIIRKSRMKKIPNFKVPKELNQKEIDLVLKMNEFEKACFESYKQLNPSIIANYSYEIAKVFNEFYHALPVLDSKEKDFRINLVNAFKETLKNSLNLLGIEVLEVM